MSRKDKIEVTKSDCGLILALSPEELEAMTLTSFVRDFSTTRLKATAKRIRELEDSARRRILSHERLSVIDAIEAALPDDIHLTMMQLDELAKAALAALGIEVIE